MEIKKIVTLLTGALLAQTLSAQPFVHPGLLQDQSAITRIREAVLHKTEPVYTAFTQFSSNPQSQYSYQQHEPLALVGRNPTVGQSAYDADANAAYQNALMWVITGDRKHAEKAEAIVDGWAATLKEINGKDAVLMAGLGPFKMVNAAELLRYTDKQWPADHIKQAEQHFRTVIYPVLKDFAPFANGNWDSAALKTVMAIAIFTNDRPMFERALSYYTHGAGDGCITNYIINEAGQCQESGRDQSHTQLGLAHLADCCEMAWHQGIDLYGINNNLLLKGFEYTASYNLGNEVPFQATLDRTGKYAHSKISEETRGRLRPVYEEVYNHFVNRLGMQAPYTAAAAARLRPEGAAAGADHIGFGTLLYTIPAHTTTPLQKPAAPAALYARTGKSGIALQWVPARFADHYIVKRAAYQNGPYQVIADNLKNTAYTDQSIHPHQPYYYTVIAVNRLGQSAQSQVLPVVAGLRAGWQADMIGGKADSSFTIDNGTTISLETPGKGFNLNGDELYFLNRPAGLAETIAMRYQPQLSSQFTGFGLSVRGSKSNRSAFLALVVRPLPSGQTEAPAWMLQLLIRRNSGDTTGILTSIPLTTTPAVSNGRLTGTIFLQLKKQQDHYTAHFSFDGNTWQQAGTADLPLGNQPLSGVIAYSGLARQTTQITINNLTVHQSSN